jgi:hypothetical protein
VAYPGGRAVPIPGPGDRPKKGRVLVGPWPAASASGDEDRDYARHARSLSARRARQRVLVLALAGLVAVVAAVVAGPRAVRMFTARPDVALRAAAAARTGAAGWITQWVAQSAFVACDPVMCGVLRGHGISPARFVVLYPDSPDPLESDVVVETAVVRSMFPHHRLAAVYAPAVLARFGSGNAMIKIRVTVSIGSAARYERQLRADVRARLMAGRELLGNSNIAAIGAAARQLRDGRVDARILQMLAPLASRIGKLTILRFGGAGPGASRGMPLLSVDLTAGDPVRGSNPENAGYSRVETPASLARIMAFMAAQRQPLQPASCRVLTVRNGVTFIRIDYAAPSPFNVLPSTP